MTAKRSRTDNDHFCQFPFADGRLCRMLRQPNHPTLCVFHARQERQILDAESIGADVSQSFSGHFTTAGDINHVLGKLFKAVAKNRIPPRNAQTLAYIGNLLLKSVDPIKSDIYQAYSPQTWNDLVHETFSAEDKPQSAPDPQASPNPQPNSDSPKTTPAPAPTTKVA